MRAPRTLLLIALAVLLACLAALPAGPTAAQELAGVYDGEWTGTTSQGQPISFTVAGDTVTRIVVKVRIAPCTITSTTTGNIPIAGNGFSAATYDQGITGTFDTATTASGTGFLTSSNQVCPGTANLTWTASRPPPLTYSIGGTVRDGSGAPVSGAQISVVPPTGGQPVTGADGSYALSVPAGTYTLLAAKDGYIAGAPVTVTVPPDKAGADLLLTPVERPTVRGTVRDPGGAPVAGALVIASPRSGGALAEAQTDAAGAYTLSLDPGTYDLQASKEGFTAAQAFNVTVPPSQSGVDMRLGAVTATISGTVRDDKGAPVGGAEVRAVPAQGSQSPVITTSAADGSYTLSVPAGAYSVQAARAGYTPSPALAVVVPPDRAGADLVLAHPPVLGNTVYLPLLAKPGPAAPPTPVPPGDPSYDGAWSGTASNGRAVSFRVEGNKVTELGFGFDFAQECGFSGTSTRYFPTPLPIVDGAFQSSSSSSGPVALSATFKASFNSERSAGGSIEMSIATSFPNPSCRASKTVTWTASR